MRSAGRLFPLLVAMCLAATCFAQDAQLAALHATLETLHEHASELRITPELTVAKRQRRDWIESQLDSLDGDPQQVRSLETKINQELRKVGIKDSADDQNLLGSLGDVGLDEQSGMLIVTTGVGVICESDSSIYAYKRVDGHWKRVLESEQDDYSPGRYTPQAFDAVHVWQSFKDGRPDGPAYMLALANEWGCASAWHSVYYKVWRIDQSESKLLIDQSGFAWLRARAGYIVGSIVEDPAEDSSKIDVLIEYTEGSIDGGVHNREAIRHFLIDGDTVRRVAPVALSPRDFVDEWLSRPWSESGDWSTSPSLRQWHERVHKDFVSGDFGDTMHCDTPDLWQVEFAPSDDTKKYSRGDPDYFLVRWTPPYRFTMVSVSPLPLPSCMQPDTDADQWRTLFNTQGWRW